ncbi:hypothetical protein QN277_013523 [Acacia crassicarpa]|uniref:Phytocyanin domain-containing protein n=1 Tax=Acacia crassicarpa TaxID=499986 RepID=A0AAE1TEG2_9FABA|nr:hypothetical protein QN277_013523 [Acacia crassicarpa]
MTRVGPYVDFNYTEWAQDKVFVVGDILVFKYDNRKHNVVKVNGTMFQSCTVRPERANQALTSGNDVINLATPEKKWCICSVAYHCSTRGMKLVINVMPSPAPYVSLLGLFELALKKYVSVS